MATLAILNMSQRGMILATFPAIAQRPSTPGGSCGGCLQPQGCTQTGEQSSACKQAGAGKAKQQAGKAVGNDRLRAKGAAQELKGDAQQTLGKAKGAVKDAADKVDAAAHRKL